MIVAMCCTENWYQYLVTNIHSLLRTTKTVKKIYLLLETDNIDDVPYLKDVQKRYPVEIVVLNFHSIFSKYVLASCPNVNTVYSNFCFGRLMLADVVQEDKVLYLDSDAVVRKDISDIWIYDVEDYYLAGCKDYGIIRDGTYNRLDIKKNYVNSGVVVFNLKKIREEGIVQKWFDIINTQELKYPDQDAMNMICTEKEFYLPPMYNTIWNVTIEPRDFSLIKVYHYAGIKDPWVADKIYGNQWYDSYEKFYHEIVVKDC